MNRNEKCTICKAPADFALSESNEYYCSDCIVAVRIMHPSGSLNTDRRVYLLSMNHEPERIN